jgi:sugar lactone lactonase YvrE
MKTPPVTIASDIRCELAENPLWYPEKHCVYWTDIPAGNIYCLDDLTGECRRVYRGPPVGGFTIQFSGDLLLFRVNDIAQLHSDGRVTSLRTFSDDGMERFNDVIADPQGRVFAGTLGQHPNCGVYRVDLDGTITKLFAGTGCSNGMGFSPDLKIFYWTCTTTRRIFQFDYDRDSGAVLNQRIFYQATADEGLPDGLTVDAEGGVWSARWGGGAVIRYGPGGKVLDRLDLPVTNITSVCFGGKDLREMFITSAKDAGRSHEAAGALFRTAVNTCGGEEFRSRIRFE